MELYTVTEFQGVLFIWEFGRILFQWPTPVSICESFKLTLHIVISIYVNYINFLFSTIHVAADPSLGVIHYMLKSFTAITNESWTVKSLNLSQQPLIKPSASLQKFSFDLKMAHCRQVSSLHPSWQKRKNHLRYIQPHVPQWISNYSFFLVRSSGGNRFQVVVIGGKNPPLIREKRTTGDHKLPQHFVLFLKWFDWEGMKRWRQKSAASWIAACFFPFILQVGFVPFLFVGSWKCFGPPKPSDEVPGNGKPWVGFLPALPVVDGVQDLSAYEMSDSGQLKLTEATWVAKSFQKGLDFRWTFLYLPGSKLEFVGWCPIKHGGQWKEMITRRSRSASLKVKINGFSLIRVIFDFKIFHGTWSTPQNFCQFFWCFFFPVVFFFLKKDGSRLSVMSLPPWRCPSPGDRSCLIAKDGFVGLVELIGWGWKPDGIRWNQVWYAWNFMKSPWSL